MATAKTEPRKVLKTQKAVKAARWAALLLTTVKEDECYGTRISVAINDENVEMTLKEVGKRLLAICTDAADMPTAEEAHKLWRDYFLCPCEVLITIDSALHDDKDFDWEGAIYDIRSQIPPHDEDFEEENYAEQIKRYAFPWRVREELKLVTGCYGALPWKDLEPIKDHYAHRGVHDPLLVSFTQNEEKGKRGQHVTLKPGRYLQKYYPHLDSDKIRELAAQVTADGWAFNLARTEEEIINVYKNGPHSCMVAKDVLHQLRVYADSDLAVAYITDPKQNNKITGRSVVWPEKRVYNTVYGDETRMHQRLKVAGYREGEVEDCFAGAKIRRIPAHPDCKVKIVLPYLDCATSFDLSRKHPKMLILRSEGCGRQDGEMLKIRVKCPKCNKMFLFSPRGDGYMVDWEAWCNDCAKRAMADQTVLRCPVSGWLYRKGNGVKVRTSWRDSSLHCREPQRFRDDMLSKAYIEGNGGAYRTFMCAGSGILHARNAGFTEVKMADGSTWSNAHFHYHGVTGNDGKKYAREKVPQDQKPQEFTDAELAGFKNDYERTLARARAARAGVFVWQGG